MRANWVAVAALLALAACGRNSDPVGENSAGSVKTTAVGTIVGAEPGPTPTASPLVAAPAPDDIGSVAINAVDNAQ